MNKPKPPLHLPGLETARWGGWLKTKHVPTPGASAVFPIHQRCRLKFVVTTRVMFEPGQYSITGWVYGLRGEKGVSRFYPSDAAPPVWERIGVMALVVPDDMTLKSTHYLDLDANLTGVSLTPAPQFGLMFRVMDITVEEGAHSGGGAAVATESIEHIELQLDGCEHPYGGNLTLNWTPEYHDVLKCGMVVGVFVSGGKP